MRLSGYYSRAGTIISRDCTPLNKELPDYAAAPQFGRIFRVFYYFQLESGIVTSFFLLYEASSAAVAVSEDRAH